MINKKKKTAKWTKEKDEESGNENKTFPQELMNDFR